MAVACYSESCLHLQSIHHLSFKYVRWLKKVPKFLRECFKASYESTAPDLKGGRICRQQNAGLFSENNWWISASSISGKRLKAECRCNLPCPDNAVWKILVFAVRGKIPSSGQLPQQQMCPTKAMWNVVNEPNPKLWTSVSSQRSWQLLSKHQFAHWFRQASAPIRAPFTDRQTEETLYDVLTVLAHT